MKVVYDDGGRKAAGFKGSAGDCVARAVSIAAQRSYDQVYSELAEIQSSLRKTKRMKKAGIKSARDGIYVKSKAFKDYMAKWGFEWTPTMLIGSGCKVHLTDGELPSGRLVVSVSKHYTAVIDGVVHDTHDPQRDVHCIEPDDGRALKTGEWRNENGICRIERRCVYGYWRIV
jgi:hypothetical protein